MIEGELVAPFTSAMASLKAFSHALIHDEKNLKEAVERGDMSRGRVPPKAPAQLLDKIQHDVSSRRRAIVDFIGILAREYPNPRFARLGFDFIATRIPNAFAIHVRADDSYAIGLDPTIHEMLTWLVLGSHWAHRNNHAKDFIQIVA